ncbi:MAG: bestrophin family ion channel [Bryobacteraceae bacterium]
MIVRDHLPLRRTWPHVSRKISGLVLLYLAIAVAHEHFHWTWLSLPAFPLAMIGGALSVFLGFRNNSAYDRWWEARTLWGGMVNTSRTFARQVLTFVDENAEPELEHSPRPMSRESLVELQIAYVHALRCHLRKQNPFPELEKWLPVEIVAYLRSQKNVPLALLMLKAQVLRQYFDEGRLDSFRLSSLDGTLTELCNVQGACERIKNTPLPRQYHHFPRVLVSVFSYMLPLGLVDGLGMLMPVAASLVSFIFVSLDTIGEEIENPFENTVHDTPMSSLSRAIEINLRQNLGRVDLPPEVRAVDGFLY